MKIQELKELQPQIFYQFEQVLESGRLNHAYLFSGDFASLEMALFLTQCLFCQEKDGVLPCGNCRSCKLIQAEEFPDLTIVRPQNQLIKTETIRDLVRSFSQSGVEGSKQVFVISQAEKMHANAANSLLKVMEEPESEIYLFLLTADAEKVLPTIRSRAQLIQFPKNLPYLERKFEELGLLKDQSQALAGLTSSLKEGEKLIQSGFTDRLAACKRFAKLYLEDQTMALLECPRLARLADDRNKQAEIFQLVEGIWAKELSSQYAIKALENLSKARGYWQANVSFQSSLEWLCLT